MPNGPYVLRSPPNLFDNHLDRRKLPRLQTGDVRRIRFLGPWANKGKKEAGGFM
jgi:hypothetical protein